LTKIGHVAGSPSYIAPEAWGGEPDTLDSRVDVYGLAAVVFRSLAGRPPFQAAKVYDLYRMVTEAKRPSLHELRPDLPEDIDAWVEQSLSISPEHRFSSVRALWTALSVLASRESQPPSADAAAPVSLDAQSALTEAGLLDPDDQPTPIDLPSADVLSLQDSAPRPRAGTRAAPAPASRPGSAPAPATPAEADDSVPTERELEPPTEREVEVPAEKETSDEAGAPSSRS
jgi:serine/threonine protein kinase